MARSWSRKREGKPPRNSRKEVAAAGVSRILSAAVETANRPADAG